MIRFAVVAALIPTIAVAEVCDRERPNWDGLPVSAITETLVWLTTPTVLLLILATALAIYFQQRWVSVVLALFWASLIPFLFTQDLDDVYWEAWEEGCIGPSDLSIGLCAAICILTLYLACRPRGRPSSGENEC